MTRQSASSRTDRRRGAFAMSALPVPAALGWVLTLLAVLLCCSPAATSATGAGTPAAASVQAITPTPAAAVPADAPDGRGHGSSCHGTSGHATPVVLPGPAAPVALPCAGAVAPAGPLTRAVAIRGPANDSVGAVDHLRLQIQRV